MKKGVWFGVGALLLFCYYDIRSDDDQKEQFKLVRAGMAEGKVIEILGRPANVQRDTSDKTVYFYYGYNSRISLYSTTPTVTFDSMGKVKYAVWE